MKLIRFGPPGREKPGIIAADGSKRDATSLVDTDFDRDFFDGGGLDRFRLALSENNGGTDLPQVPEDARLGPPVPRPGKIICIGLNYRDHAEETGAELPKEPVIFFKATTASTAKAASMARAASKSRAVSRARTVSRAAAVARASFQLAGSQQGRDQ